MSLIINDKQLVTPGDLLADGEYIGGENTFQDKDKIYAARIGLASIRGKRVYVVALKGCYMPQIGDPVVGKVIEVEMSGWSVDIGSPYTAMLFVSEALDKPFNPRRDELTKYFTVGDVVLAKVISLDRTNNPILTVRGAGLGKMTRGYLVSIAPAKIPRLIGRKGSMINMLKRETGCSIIVGQNGRIIVSGRKPEDETLAISAIHMIDLEAHTAGLTDRIATFFKEKKLGTNNLAKKEG